MTGTMNDPLFGGSGGLWWSNMTGILFFHIGNVPVTAMWVNQAATWFLVAGNVFSTAAPGSQSLFAVTSAPVAICQMMGSGLLLVGSLVYTGWCDGFTNFSY